MSSSPVGHWWIQRVSSLLLVPLVLWFLWAAVTLAGADHASAGAFMGRPLNALAAVLLTGIGMYHATLGIQTIVEDYLSPGLGKLLLTIARIGSLAGLLAVIAAVFKLSFGA